MSKLLSRRGFTIVELVIVVAVIGILATIVTVAFRGVQQSARDKAALSDADALDAIQTEYSLKNTGVAGKAWYSGSGADVDIPFTPSPGNVVDIVVDTTDYCIRVYNPNGSASKTIGTAATKESSAGTCDRLIASAAAGGTIAAPASITVTRPGNFIQLDVSWPTVAAAATYRIEYSTSSTFTSSTFINSILGTSYTFTPAPPTGSQLYYVRVYSVSAGAIVSSASPYGSATTGTVSPP
jgi:prepilin-type N-terminal cleavage/methylation domain-containing protein